MKKYTLAIFMISILTSNSVFSYEEEKLNVLEAIKLETHTNPFDWIQNNFRVDIGTIWWNSDPGIYEANAGLGFTLKFQENNYFLIKNDFSRLVDSNLLIIYNDEIFSSKEIDNKLLKDENRFCIFISTENMFFSINLEREVVIIIPKLKNIISISN